jgi:hypothetical protein
LTAKVKAAAALLQQAPCKKYEQIISYSHTHYTHAKFWLVVWNMAFFPYILEIITPADEYFSEGFKPPTRSFYEPCT